MKVSVFKLYLLLKSGIVSSHIFISFPPNTLRLTFSSTFFFSALRGPPLDENLLLSNIATANKKVEHLTEVRFTVKDLTDATGLFLILETQARALNID